MGFYIGSATRDILISTIKTNLVNEGWIDYDPTYNVIQTPTTATYQFFVRFISIDDQKLSIACYLNWDNVNHTGSQSSNTKDIVFFDSPPNTTPPNVNYILRSWGNGFILWLKGDPLHGSPQYNLAYIGDLAVVTDFPHPFPVIFMCSSYFSGASHLGSGYIVAKNRFGEFVWGGPAHYAHLVSIPPCSTWEGGYTINGDVNTPDGQRLWMPELYLVAAKQPQGVYGRLQYIKGITQDIAFFDGDELIDQSGNSFVVANLYNRYGEFCNLLGAYPYAYNIKRVAIQKI